MLRKPGASRTTVSGHGHRASLEQSSALRKPRTYHSGEIFREMGEDEVAQLSWEFDVDTAQIKVEAPVGHMPGAEDGRRHICGFCLPKDGEGDRRANVASGSEEGKKDEEREEETG